MKFSIIIPAHNSEHTIERCLNSLIDQCYSNFEVIIIDDGSTDNTGDVCLRFCSQDDRFLYLCHENKGVSFSRNRGIDAATGDYILFLDSDDQYKCEYLKEFYKVISESENCNNFWCSFSSYDIFDNHINDALYDSTDRYIIHENKSNILHLQSRQLVAPLWTKAFKRDIIIKHNIYMRNDLSLGEDLLFNYEYLDHSGENIKIINRPLYRYTKADNGTLDSKYRPDLDAIYKRLNNEIYKYLTKWSISKDDMYIFYNSVFYSFDKVMRNTYRNENTMSKKEKKSYNRRILNSKEFQESLKKSTCYIHPLYRFGYKIRSWGFIRLIDIISQALRL